MPSDPEDEAILSYLKSTAGGHPPRPGYNPTHQAARRLFGDVRIKTPLTRLERLFLPPGPYAREDVEAARMHAGGWEDYGFSYDEVASWLKNGLEPRESHLAALLVEEGIEPYRLSEEIVHARTGRRLTILAVARSEPEARAYDSRKTLCDVLDEAGIERTRGEPVLPKWLRKRGSPTSLGRP
jgi:hypothetical protein